MDPIFINAEIERKETDKDKPRMYIAKINLCNVQVVELRQPEKGEDVDTLLCTVWFNDGSSGDYYISEESRIAIDKYTK